MDLHRRTGRPPAVEPLEPRWLLSSATLRIVTYNIEADINNDTGPLPGMATVLEGIGQQSIGGDTQPIDVLALQETTSNTQTVQPIVNDLNSDYGSGTYALSTYQASEVDAMQPTATAPTH